MTRVATVTLLLLLPLCVLFESTDAQDGAEALLGTVDLSEWDAWFSEELPEVPFRPSDFVASIARLEDPVSEQGLIEHTVSFVLPSLKTAVGKLVLFLAIGIMAATLNGMTSADSAAETAKAAFRIAAACIALTAVFSELRGVYRMLQTVRSASEWLLAPLLAFLTLGGMEHTAGLLGTSFALLSSAIVRVLEGIVVPLGCIGGVLITLDACASGRLASVGRLILRAAYWLLGILCTGFGLLSAIRGAAAAGADGLLLRTAKLAAGSLPTVGGVVSDSVDTAYQCLLFVKNALGVGGAVLVLLICAKPILSAFCTRCSLRAASMLSEPLSGKPYADLLRALSDMMQVLMLSELAASAMALMTLAPVLLVGVGS